MEKCQFFHVHKKDDKSDPNNYRPISVLSTVGKVIERLIIYDYLSRNKILTKHQPGFRSLHSTVTALLDETNECMVFQHSPTEGDTNVVVFSGFDQSLRYCIA